MLTTKGCSLSLEYVKEEPNVLKFKVQSWHISRASYRYFIEYRPNSFGVSGVTHYACECAKADEQLVAAHTLLSSYITFFVLGICRKFFSHHKYSAKCLRKTIALQWLMMIAMRIEKILNWWEARGLTIIKHPDLWEKTTIPQVQSSFLCFVGEDRGYGAPHRTYWHQSITGKYSHFACLTAVVVQLLFDKCKDLYLRHILYRFSKISWISKIIFTILYFLLCCGLLPCRLYTKSYRSVRHALFFFFGGFSDPLP